MKMYIVDAFADRVFAGNPAAVCYLEAWPDDAVMQKMAVENNLSETAFLVKEGGQYHIRWFTPRYEIDLCGHATLASAFVLHSFVDPAASEIPFSSRSGDLNVSCEDGVYTLDFPSRPAAPAAPPEGLEKALGMPIRELYLSRDLMAVVENEEAVRRARPDFSRLLDLDLGDGVILTAPGSDCDFVSRCFYPKCGVNEDPVTGSAHCNLIPFWSKRLGKTEMLAKQLSERGGTLYCRDAGERVLIGGTAVLYAVSEVYI